ncbi:MAG TPA: response regulator [Chthonomonadales bacterium]|nr:response regulator [Chthonomonadales bacterium]
MARLLVVDDEDEVREVLVRRLSREGYAVTAAESAAAARQALAASDGFDVVVTDMSMEQADSGLDVLRDAMAHDVFTEVIVLTAYGNVQNAVESMRRGAFDYLEKNLPGVDVLELLIIKVGQAVERRRAAVNTLRRLDTRVSRMTPP